MEGLGVPRTVAGSCRAGPLSCRLCRLCRVAFSRITVLYSSRMHGPVIQLIFSRPLVCRGKILEIGDVETEMPMGMVMERWDIGGAEMGSADGPIER